MSFSNAAFSKVPPQQTPSLAPAIYAISQNVAKIQRSVDTFGTLRDTPELRHSITTLIEETNIAIKEVSASLIEFVTEATDSDVPNA